MNKKIYLVCFCLLIAGMAMVVRRNQKTSFNKEATDALYSYLLNDSASNAVSSLLLQGADPNFNPGWPSRGLTPLHIAARGRAFEIAKILVKAGATNGIKDGFGQTALDTLKFAGATPEEIQNWKNLLNHAAHSNDVKTATPATN